MGATKETTNSNREAILISALLTTPSISDVAQKTGFSRSWIYKTMKSDSFQEKMQEARQKAVDDAVSILQGNLAECANTLMDIVRDKNASPQVRVNAVNAVFQNLKGFSKDNASVLGMAVRFESDGFLQALKETAQTVFSEHPGEIDE